MRGRNLFFNKIESSDTVCINIRNRNELLPASIWEGELYFIQHEEVDGIERAA